jgi:hypothetical protein
MGSPHWLARDNRIPGGRGSLLQWTAYDLAFRVAPGVAAGVAAGWGFGTLLNRLGRGAGEFFGKKTSEGIFDAITVRGALIAVLLVLVWMACTARPAGRCRHGNAWRLGSLCSTASPPHRSCVDFDDHGSDEHGSDDHDGADRRCRSSSVAAADVTSCQQWCCR